MLHHFVRDTAIHRVLMRSNSGIAAAMPRRGLRAAAALAATLALALLLPVASQNDRLSTRDLSDPTAAGDVWATFSRSENTLLRGPVLVSAATADSDAACAKACAAAQGCLFWSWCPEVIGCDALSYCNTTAGEASTLLLPGFSCLLTGDTVEGLQQRTAAYIMKGPAVTWVGGLWSPQQAQQGSADGAASGRKLLGRAGGPALTAQQHSAGSGAAAAGLPAPLLQLGGSGSSGRRRALLQGGDSTNADGIWQQYTRENNTLYRGPSLAGPPRVAVDEADCATECSKQPNCTQWALCPASETKGCQLLEWCDPATDAYPSTVLAGTCLLSYDPQEGRDAYIMLQGPAVTWSSGFLNASAVNGSAPAPPPSSEPSPAPSPESPSPPADSPSPPASPADPPASPAESPSSPPPSDSPAPSGDCPPPGKMCGGLCIDVTKDPMNCGFCANQCFPGSGEMCMGGICMCGAGQRRCGTQCANILLDSSNCGSCGWSCFGRGSGMCMMGVCQ
ncbi:EGF domain-containing [Chlorella sorokiniana]|uniref:EGF domain-containing n=1 Tax=Chlorella sorokiniana TaxID=3076 RepID=A0A2P6TUR6_CHLSO|nr:EGF domain-containing [Chlorella sorokiniana]|eukprot:PRW57815.1 EGF domain-containing [Chlorella sorokiniana]